MRVFVTGAAGFIGYHVCSRLLAEGHTVYGIDNLNDYYSPRLKKDRLSQLAGIPAFNFSALDLSDSASLQAAFAQFTPTHVLNLAAQAGVRYSLQNPQSYIASNLVGFANLLECCRHYPVEHLVFASSSSVYGLNTHMPYGTDQGANHPVSLYAATKKSNEMMAHSYSHLFGIPATGLRFFTVYGPWGRPDMAPFIFTKAILAGDPIPVFNHGKSQRDFTYIDDIVDGVVRLLPLPATPSAQWNADEPDPSISSAPYRLYNIGNNQSVPLMRFIEILEAALEKKAIVNLLPMQAGDVAATYADIDPLAKATGFSPSTSLEKGIPAFVEWYRQYHCM